AGRGGPAVHPAASGPPGEQGVVSIGASRSHTSRSITSSGSIPIGVIIRDYLVVVVDEVVFVTVFVFVSVDVLVVDDVTVVLDVDVLVSVLVVGVVTVVLLTDVFVTVEVLVEFEEP